MEPQIPLANGCRCSAPSVFPANWKTCNKSALQLKWAISYYFYDPSQPARKLVRIRSMNYCDTLIERRKLTKALIDAELKALQNRNYNPFSKKYTSPAARGAGPMHEELPIMEAFRLAHAKLKTSPAHINEVRIALNRFEKGVIELGIQNTYIGKFRRSELKQVLEHLKLTDAYFNKFRAYLSSLFKELVEYECCEVNLTRDIQKRTTVKNQREVLSREIIFEILDKIRPKLPEFHRYGMIFYYSAGRSTELFSVQAKHVRLNLQEYDVLIKKGKQYIWETKVIMLGALPFWNQIMKLATSPEDYLFSHGLVPGPLKNSSKQITIRWRDHVKNKLGILNGIVVELDRFKKATRITADFYSLKHSFLDLLSSMGEDAVTMASHRNDKTTQIYTINAASRKNEKLKRVQL